MEKNFSVFCPNVDKFVTCIEEPLRTSCGNEAYALVMKAIERYGCPSKIGKFQTFAERFSSIPKK